jgi:DMSO/TMAO reductase YedYZ heme-binding membrane subunit
MRFVAGLVIAIVLVAAFKRPIRKIPGVFYAIALALSGLLIVGQSLHLPSWFKEYFLFLFQSNTLAMGFFTIVMFAGTFKENSLLKKTLIPIRAELSIIASLLCTGHIANYGSAYLEQLLSTTTIMPYARLCATIVAILLVVVLIPLTITSLKVLRARIKTQTWKRIQRLSYPFYLMVFVHMFIYLLPPAFAGSTSAAISLLLYFVVGVGYLTARIRLYLQTRTVGANHAVSAT